MRDMNATQLAKLLKITPQSVSRYLSGDSFPSIENLVLMSEIFKISIDDMIKKDLRDGVVALEPTPEYEKVQNVDKLIRVFEDFTQQLKEIKSESNE